MIFENVKYVFLIFSLNLPCILLSAGITLVDPEKEAYQIVFTEIMADPLPQIALPVYEYLEIFNRSNTTIDLSNWKLIAGTHETLISNGLIQSHEYLIICDAEADSLFSRYGKTLPVETMPPLLNTGQVLVLKAASGEIVHTARFSPDWHNKDKTTGGWSLEIIDTNNPCNGENNWSSSIDPRGGTPGCPNSIMGKNPDTEPPMMFRTTLPTDSTVLIYFSEPLKASSLSAVQNYSVNNGLLHPDESCAVEPDYTKALLIYHTSFSHDHVYTLSVLNNMEDCAGNMLTGNSLSDFALSRSPESFDVVINEIQFNTSDNGAEFIELYNRSQKVIECSDLVISLADPASHNIIKNISFSSYPYILFPETYVAVTSDAISMENAYSRMNPRTILEQPYLFSLPDEEGILVLSDTSDQIIDECYYNKKMHESIISDAEDVSLERIEPDVPSSDPENWHSASTSSGYCTPGIQNSQMVEGDIQWNIALSPEIISPDDDGIDDMVTVHLHLNEAGWIGSLSIYNLQGQLIKPLINQSLFGTEEYFIWDGKRNDGRVAERGLYLLYGEMFSPQGKSKNFKKVITLVRK